MSTIYRPKVMEPRIRPALLRCVFSRCKHREVQLLQSLRGCNRCSYSRLRNQQLGKDMPIAVVIGQPALDTIRTFIRHAT